MQARNAWWLVMLVVTGLLFCRPTLGSLPVLPGKAAFNKDLAVGFVETGQIKSFSLSNGFFSWTKDWIGPGSRELYKGEDYYLELSLFLGIPEGPWSPKVLDPAVGDSVSLGPAVSESASFIDTDGPQGPDWGPWPGSRGRYFSGDLLVGQLYPETSPMYQTLPVMATSTLPETWPLDLYGFRSWPGPWSRDPETGAVRQGSFVGDQDLFFCFTDRGYASRVFQQAQS
ncbi:MAG: hypothetical protein H5U03_02805, partial [Clostridia bacterium]|nr:hypothetical protein [Clostridia bacterium]